METYDFIIVGAGSAGCLLAERLSTDPRNSVLLLEAGSKARNPLYNFPMLAGSLYRNRMNNWFYSTEPQPHLNNRRVFMPRGKMVGGSFIFNGMVYIRGQAADYDHWAQLGNRGWSYADVLPYFKKSERYEDGANEFHGGDGQLVVNHAKSSNPLFNAFVKAGVEAGYPHNRDFNGGDQEGFGRFDFCIRDGRRWNTASAFLKPALNRKNLRVISGAHATKIIVKRERAVGIEFSQGGKSAKANANREVILCSGAINSPQLLMLSGIGDPVELHRHGIDLVHNLPGVGQNLQDHLDVTVAYQCKESVSLINELRVDRFFSQFLRSVLTGSGPVSDSAIEAGCFLALTPGATSPDTQTHFMPIYSNGAKLWVRKAKADDLDRGQTFAARIGPARPQSRGYVGLKSADPRMEPAIQPMYLSARADMELTRESVRKMREIIQQPAFDRYRGIEINPGSNVRSDDEIDAWIRENATTVHHPVGTAKMGIDKMAVVDPELRVHGIAGLRVVDASVMPTLVSGNTNAPTIMIAERAADLILARTSVKRWAA